MMICLLFGTTTKRKIAEGAQLQLQRLPPEQDWPERTHLAAIAGAQENGHRQLAGTSFTDAL